MTTASPAPAVHVTKGLGSAVHVAVFDINSGRAIGTKCSRFGVARFDGGYRKVTHEVTCKSCRRAA